VSLAAYNVPAGLDRLLHGAEGQRGWGQSAFGRADDALLYPRGFDQAEQRFVYEVNEQFGDRRRAGRFGRGAPFQVQLSARLAVGSTAQGGQAAMAGMVMGGRGGRGGAPGGRGGGMRADPGAAEGGGPDAGAIVERLIPEPISAIVALRDTLGLSDDQVARLEAVADTLRARNEPVREKVREAFAAGRGGADPGELFRQVGPDVNEGRANVEAALSEAQTILTPEQWRQVPAALRNVLSGFGGRGGGARPGGGGGRPPRQ
jgi:hypothetical protein